MTSQMQRNLNVSLTGRPEADFWILRGALRILIKEVLFIVMKSGKNAASGNLYLK